MTSRICNAASLLGRSPEDYDLVEAANDDEECVELETEYVDHLDRKLFCRIGFNFHSHEAEWIDIWDANGERVNADLDTRDAIVREALR